MGGSLSGNLSTEYIGEYTQGYKVFNSATVPIEVIKNPTHAEWRCFPFGKEYFSNYAPEFPFFDDDNLKTISPGEAELDFQFCLKAYQIANKQYVMSAFQWRVLSELSTEDAKLTLYSATAGRTTNPIVVAPNTTQDVSSASVTKSNNAMTLVDKSRPFGAFFEDASGVRYHVSGDDFVYYFQPGNATANETDYVTVAVKGVHGFTVN
jgi:hypothetical protein